MKIIIFSDIHGNLEAFEAFILKAASIDHERMYNLGDTIGYGADPNRCVELVKEHDIPSVTGNHEDVALGRSDGSMYNPDAKRAVMWCKNELSQKNLDLLRNFGDFIWLDCLSGKTLLVHGSPADKDGYIMNEKIACSAFEAMERQGIQTSFVGHTHRPCVWTRNPDGSAKCFIPTEPDQEITLSADSLAIVNVGSVGQPRDGNPDGCFIVWNDLEHSVKFVRFGYDVAMAQKKIRESGLPGTIADRLATGN